MDDPVQPGRFGELRNVLNHRCSTDRCAGRLQENLAEVKVPSGFDYPRPQRLNALSGIHKVSSDRVYVVDAQTFLIPNFTYDGTAPGRLTSFRREMVHRS
jgi:hypothetical protein